MAEKIPTYIDFESGEIKEVASTDSLPKSNIQLPEAYVVMNTTNVNPATDLGYGSWNLLGSTTIGSTMVYFFEYVIS